MFFQLVVPALQKLFVKGIENKIIIKRNKIDSKLKNIKNCYLFHKNSTGMLV